MIYVDHWSFSVSGFYWLIDWSASFRNDGKSTSYSTCCTKSKACDA